MTNSGKSWSVVGAKEEHSTLSHSHIDLDFLSLSFFVTLLSLRFFTNWSLLTGLDWPLVINFHHSFLNDPHHDMIMGVSTNGSSPVARVDASETTRELLCAVYLCVETATIERPESETLYPITSQNALDATQVSVDDLRQCSRECDTVHCLCTVELKVVPEGVSLIMRRLIQISVAGVCGSL